jgi:signal transduction histidine kinase
MGVLQIGLFPRNSLTLSLQIVIETVFATIVFFGMLGVVSSNKGVVSSEGDLSDVYILITAGVSMIGLRAVTDVLDEFLEHPEWVLTVLEDGSMIVGVVLLFIGIRRWSRLHRERESDLRAQRDELTQQNERLNLFADIVSHDLRNPLNVAMAHLELSREDSDQSHYDSIKKSLNRMETIIQDVLTLSRVGSGGINAEPVSLNKICRRAWNSVETNGAELALEANDDAQIIADATTVQRLFENLFRNAVEHAGDSVTVSIGLTDDGFYIEDSGDGIPQSERDAVFEAGYSETAQGTGLGLQIVEQISYAHGWTVNLTESEEGGARFEIYTS